MSSTPQPSLASVYRERAACMASWNAKLSLAVAMRDAWANLDLENYPVGSAPRAATAMELVTQTVRDGDVPFSFSCPKLTLLFLESPTGLAQQHPRC